MSHNPHPPNPEPTAPDPAALPMHWYESIDDDGIGGVDIRVDDDRIQFNDDRFRSYSNSCTLEQYLNETEQADRVTFRQLVKQNMTSDHAAEIEQEIRRRVADPGRRMPLAMPAEPQAAPKKRWWQYWKEGN